MYQQQRISISLMVMLPLLIIYYLYFIGILEWLKTYKTVTVDIEWFIKCVGQYNLLNFRPFVLCSDNNICDLDYPDVLVQ